MDKLALRDLDKQAKKYCIIVGKNCGRRDCLYRTICLQHNNFHFDADCMQLYPGNQSVNKLHSVKNTFRIHRHTIT